MSKRRIVVALAGNANVGKSVIFNHLTGMHQHIGNWPGKTVKKAEGTLYFKGYTIDVVDLPGIYSLSTFSMEELITREYVAVENPDVVINVIDASALERNLFFTLQLVELETPMVIALNQMDMVKKKGIEIDVAKIQDTLGLPVIPTVATRQSGIYELLEKAVEVAIKRKPSPSRISYGEEIEAKIQELSNEIRRVDLPYPSRWTAIKLLEGDERISNRIRQIDTSILAKAEELMRDIETIHGHSCSTVITSERYEIAGCIAREVQRIVPLERPPVREVLHALTTHPFIGYLIMTVTILTVFFAIFSSGDFLSNSLNLLFSDLGLWWEALAGTGLLSELVWEGIIEGLLAGIVVALPYLLPFYLILYILEDSGYLSRIAFLMDNVMHKIGLHGKAFIPMMLGVGCNVPACLGCRIMETQRERFLAIFVATLVPCAATTAVVLGLVGTYVGIQWAMMLYLINFLIILVLGRIAFKVLPGEPTGLIMEMPDYKIPHGKTVLRQTWFRLKEFIMMAFPLIVAGSFIVKLLEIANLLEPIAFTISPVTVDWLGLPVITGIALAFGILRKEHTLIMLATLLGTSNFAQVPGFGPVQMLVFTLVVMLYIPCISTIAALIRELGWKKAMIITAIEITVAIIVGGLFYRILLLSGFW